MREFSEYEREIIAECLLGDKRSTFKEFFSKSFGEKALIRIMYREKNVKISVTSNDLTEIDAARELTTVTELLRYLDDNGLVMRIHPLVSLQDFENSKTIEIGEFADEGKSATSVQTSTKVTDFIKASHDDSFEATEPLRALVRRGFLSHEEWRHSQSLNAIRRGQRIAIYSVVASILAAALTNFYGLYTKARTTESLTFQIDKLIERISNDSIITLQLRWIFR